MMVLFLVPTVWLWWRWAPAGATVPGAVLVVDVVGSPFSFTFCQAQILEAIGVDYIDESEVLTMADEDNHIDKRDFNVPFVCGCRNPGEALVRVCECACVRVCLCFRRCGMCFFLWRVKDILICFLSYLAHMRGEHGYA